VTCHSLRPSQYCTLTHTQVPEDSLLSSQTAGSHAAPNAPFQSVTCHSLRPSQYCTLTHTQVPEDSLLSSQTAGCHAAPNAPFQSVTCHSLRPILILHSHANSSLATDRFSFCPPKFCTQFSYIKCVLHALPIPHFILSP